MEKAALQDMFVTKLRWRCKPMCVCVCECACFSLQAEIEHRGELQRQKQQELEEALRFCLVRKFR